MNLCTDICFELKSNIHSLSLKLKRTDILTGMFFKKFSGPKSYVPKLLRLGKPFCFAFFVCSGRMVFAMDCELVNHLAKNTNEGTDYSTYLCSVINSAKTLKDTFKRIFLPMQLVLLFSIIQKIEKRIFTSQRRSSEWHCLCVKKSRWNMLL